MQLAFACHAVIMDYLIYLIVSPVVLGEEIVCVCCRNKVEEIQVWTKLAEFCFNVI